MLLLILLLLPFSYCSRQDDPRPPKERGVDDPTTPQMLYERVNEDLLAVLNRKSRAHFDDLASFFANDVVLTACFVPGRHLTVKQFEYITFYLASFYQNVLSPDPYKMGEIEQWISAVFFYNATGADGKTHYGKWPYQASMDYNKNSFQITSLNFAGNCREIPRTPPTDPLEGVDSFIDRIKMKLQSGLFLPDRQKQTLQDFEAFGDFISSDAHILACDLPVMDTKQFINWMFERYTDITDYQRLFFNTRKHDTDFEIEYGVAWTDAKRNTFRDEYVFRVRKVQEYYPQMDESFFHWKIYWITRRCPIDLTNDVPLVAYANYLTLVQKRFAQMIDGANWDVFTSFTDLFDQRTGVFNDCTGKNKSIAQLGSHMKQVAERYGSCYQTNFLSLGPLNFAATFMMSKARGMQDQEQVEVGFVGYRDEKQKVNRLEYFYFKCDT